MNKVAEVAMMTDPDRIWTEVTRMVRAELGEGPFSSYLAPSAVRVDAHGRLFIVTPTAYARDWIRKNALRRLNDLWAGLDGQSRMLEVRCRAEFVSTPPQVTPLSRSEHPQTAATRGLEPSEPRRATVAPVTDGPRAVRAAGLQERLTFDTLVEGKGNAFAIAIARQTASWADGHFNPIFFCGPYGHGKTHMLNAIAWEAQRLRPEAKVVYLSAERFVSAFVNAVRDRTTAAFKDQLRTADILLIDDVQFLANKASTQEELLSTLTALMEDGRRIVLAADRPPASLTDIEPRLRSHLAAGLTCPVEPADRELKLKVVARKLASLAAIGLVEGEARPEVVAHLVDSTQGSIRELEGAINTLAAVCGKRLSQLGVDEARAVIGSAMRGGPERRITVDEIQKLTADHFGLKQADLLSGRRTRSVARPRQIAMYLCKNYTSRSYPDIGRRFGGRDHTTVLHGVRRIEELAAKDEQIARDLEALTRKLRP